MINAARLASAKRITAVMPWYFYARQDKKSRARASRSRRKLVADMLEAAGADRVLTMDLHAGQVQGFFHDPGRPHDGRYRCSRSTSATSTSGDGSPSVSPDTGRAKLAGKFAEMIGGDLVVLNKERPAHNEAKVTDGDRRRRGQGRRDDRRHHRHRRDARRRRARRCRRRARRKVYACATHGLFNGAALRADRRQRHRQARRHGHRPGRPARASPTTSRCSRSSPASSPRRSRTSSRTTRSRRSSPARTSSFRRLLVWRASAERAARMNRVCAAGRGTVALGGFPLPRGFLPPRPASPPRELATPGRRATLDRLTRSEGGM